MLNLDTIQQRDLYKAISPHIFEYPQRFETNTGKFIRIGSVVITAPYNSAYWKLDTQHQALLHYATKGEDMKLVELVRDAIQASPNPDAAVSPYASVEDAGYFHISISGSLDPEFLAGNPRIGNRTHVAVEGESITFGAASQVGREVTGQRFQAVLGDLAFVEAF